MAVALQSTPAYALRQTEPAQVKKTLVGLEEALGAAKHKGISPTAEMTAKLRDPAQSRIKNISQLPILNREMGRVKEVLNQIRIQLDWNAYRLRRLEEWSQAAQAEYQATVGKGRTRRPGYDARAEASLKKQAELSQLVGEGVSELVSDFSDLVGGVSRFLEIASDQDQILTFQPLSVDLLSQILQAGDADGRRANFLVAFEIQEAEQRSFYLLEGLLDFLRQQDGENDLLKALLANAGVELFFLEMRGRFLALGPVRDYLERSGDAPEELLEVYQQLSHLIAEDLERFALGIKFQDSKGRLTDQFMEEYSPLDQEIVRFIQAKAAEALPAAKLPPAPAPTSPVALPSAEAASKPKRQPYVPSAYSIGRYKGVWSAWVRDHVDHGEKPVWDDSGATRGLPTSGDLILLSNLSKKTIEIYGQALSKREQNPVFMPLLNANTSDKGILEQWRTAYNELNVDTAISYSARELFETYDAASAIAHADQIRSGLNPAPAAGRLFRVRTFLNSRPGVSSVSVETVRARIDALNRLFEFVGGILPMPVPLDEQEPARPPASVPSPAVPSPALPVAPPAGLTVLIPAGEETYLDLIRSVRRALGGPDWRQAREKHLGPVGQENLSAARQVVLAVQQANADPSFALRVDPNTGEPAPIKVDPANVWFYAIQHNLPISQVVWLEMLRVHWHSIRSDIVKWSGQLQTVAQKAGISLSEQENAKRLDRLMALMSRKQKQDSGDKALSMQPLLKALELFLEVEDQGTEKERFQKAFDRLEEVTRGVVLDQPLKDQEGGQQAYWMRLSTIITTVQRIKRPITHEEALKALKLSVGPAAPAPPVVQAPRPAVERPVAEPVAPSAPVVPPAAAEPALPSAPTSPEPTSPLVEPPTPPVAVPITPASVADAAVGSTTVAVQEGSTAVEELPAETPAAVQPSSQKPSAQRPLSEHIRYEAEDISRLEDFEVFLTDLVPTLERNVFDQRKGVVSEAVQGEERAAAQREIEALFDRLLASEAEGFLNELRPSKTYAWVQNWEKARSELQDLLLRKLGSRPTPAVYRERAAKWLTTHAVELARRASTIRPDLFAGKGRVPAERLTTSGHRQVLAELFRLLAEAKQNGAELDLTLLGGEDGLKELLRTGLLQALGLALEGFSRSSSPVTAIRSAREPARRGGRGGGSHEAAMKDQEDFDQRMAKFRVARHILTHKTMLRLVIGDWKRRSGQAIEGDWQSAESKKTASIGIFKGMLADLLPEEVKVLRRLLIEGRLNGLFEDDPAPVERMDEFEDLFAGWWKVNLRKVFKPDGTVDLKVFPKTSAKIEKRVGLAVKGNQLTPVKAARIKQVLLKGSGSAVEKGREAYIRAWVNHMVAKGFLRRPSESGLEERTAEEVLALAFQQSKGVIRPDGLTFGYSLDGEPKAGVIPEQVVPLVTDDPSRRTFLLLREAHQPPAVRRILDRLDLPPELIPPGVVRMPVSAEPDQARIELADAVPEDLLVAPADLTDSEIADLLPAWVHPYVIRLGPGVADRLRSRGPNGLQELIRLAGLEEGRRLTVWNVDQVLLPDFSITVVTVDRAA